MVDQALVCHRELERIDNLYFPAILRSQQSTQDYFQ